jgi:hypothetical protein
LPNETKSRILHFCDLLSIIGLYYDSKWHELAATEILLCYNALFATFTPDPDAFRRMMADTNSMISGSTALYLLLRQPLSWTPGDVDIIAAGADYDTLLAFIKALPGANVITDTLKEGEEQPEASYPYQGLRRLVKISTSMSRFDVIQSTGSLASNAIVHYWGTHVMNAITADSIICAYPALTLACRAMVSRYPGAGDAVAKYRNRGFQIIDKAFRAADLTASCRHSAACSSRDRFFGDGDTLIIPVPSGHKYVEFSNRKDNRPYRASAWRLGGHACGTADCYLGSSPRFEEVVVVPEDL